MEDVTQSIEEINRKEEAQKRKLANLKPFKPLAELTEEERKEQLQKQSSGGLIRGEQLKKAKTMKEDCLRLLATKISREDAEKIVGESVKLIPDSDLNVQNVLLMSVVREINENGSIRGMEFLRDTSGQAPKQQIEVQADIMTDADRELIANVQKRIV